jgi:hypothetical protein
MKLPTKRSPEANKFLMHLLDVLESVSLITRITIITKA